MSIDIHQVIDIIKNNKLNEFESILCSNNIEIFQDKYREILKAVIKYYNKDALKLLIKYGGDINHKITDESLPIEYSVLNYGIHSVELLLSMHCDLTQTSNMSSIYAAALGKANILELLLANGMDANRLDYDGSNALHWAAQENHGRCIHILIKYGCDVNKLNDSGQSPLYVASGENHIRIVDILLRKGANVDLSNNSTPFQIACAYEYYNVCDHLLKAGANVNYLDQWGRTALFYAKVKQNKYMIDYLIENGASTDITDYQGVSIKDLSNDNIRRNIYQECYD